MVSNGQCPSLTACTLELQPIYYFSQVLRPAVITPFGDGNVVTIDRAPSDVEIWSSLTTLICNAASASNTTTPSTSVSSLTAVVSPDVRTTTISITTSGVSASHPLSTTAPYIQTNSLTTATNENPGSSYPSADASSSFRTTTTTIATSEYPGSSYLTTGTSSAGSSDVQPSITATSSSGDAGISYLTSTATSVVTSSTSGPSARPSNHPGCTVGRDSRIFYPFPGSDLNSNQCTGLTTFSSPDYANNATNCNQVCRYDCLGCLVYFNQSESECGFTRPDCYRDRSGDDPSEVYNPPTPLASPVPGSPLGSQCYSDGAPYTVCPDGTYCTAGQFCTLDTRNSTTYNSLDACSSMCSDPGAQCRSFPSNQYNCLFFADCCRSPQNAPMDIRG
ncbi:uncharacterized protein AB675_3544 [Cyphellophora attinorum]|uniref:Uncharacterized protein n=1 Tax=Cyphellophora attinorum TaxID=1664694 RepID=A0A0N1H3P0_9EURO|nr:uncharacterized protein AB675_3544 [Phialophora attinorum]KPI39555.1 hypothetical protein AB675_3544 [Phialophora attinorum]